MSRQPCPEEFFKIEAVKQMTEKGRSVAEVARRLGISSIVVTPGSNSTASPMSSVNKTISRLNYTLNSSASRKSEAS